MKLEPLEAIEDLQIMLSHIPETERNTLTGQRMVTALEMGIEALRRQIGYPPNLPDYITLNKTFGASAGSYKFYEPLAKYHPTAAWYLSREMLTVLKTARVDDKPIVTYTERTCYKDSTPLLCGLPVIFGESDVLGDFIYLVAQENKH